MEKYCRSELAQQRLAYAAVSEGRKEVVGDRGLCQAVSGRCARLYLLAKPAAASKFPVYICVCWFLASLKERL